MLKTATVAAALSALITFPAFSAKPAGQHMYEAVKADPALAAEFRRVMQPLFPTSPWIESFGTTAPAALETVDGNTYEVYWGCQPHNCVTESYVVMYDPKAKTISAGAFLQNSFNGPDLAESRITWLGTTEYDSARALGKYLY